MVDSLMSAIMFQFFWTASAFFIGALIASVSATIYLRATASKILRRRTLVGVLIGLSVCVLLFALPWAIPGEITLFGSKKETGDLLYSLAGLFVAPVIFFMVAVCSRDLRVVFIKRNINSFHEQIWNGFDQQKEVENNSRHVKLKIDEFSPNLRDVEKIQPQIEALRKVNDVVMPEIFRFFQNLVRLISSGQNIVPSPRIDAVVIVSINPESGNFSSSEIDLFYEQINRITKMGCIIVSIDTKFDRSRIEYPEFIGYITSDYRAGGELIGRRIIQLLLGAGKESILIIGFIDVIHERIRSEAMLRYIFRSGYEGSIVPRQLSPSWDPEDCSQTLFQAITDAQSSGRFSKDIIVYACDDNIARALSAKLSKYARSNRLRSEIKILGYNGQRDGQRYLISGAPYIDSTVDSSMTEQGRSACALVVESLFNNELPKKRTTSVSPRLEILN